MSPSGESTVPNRHAASALPSPLQPQPTRLGVKVHSAEQTPSVPASFVAEQKPEHGSVAAAGSQSSPMSLPLAEPSVQRPVAKLQYWPDPQSKSPPQVGT